MNIFIRTFIIILTIALAGWVLTTQAWAKDFKADYQTTYSLNPEAGLMHVKQVITLTNQVPNIRASSYSLTLENNEFKNMTARDRNGTMKFTQNTNDAGATVLVFTFNDRVVGVGSKLQWTLEYDSLSLAQHLGQVWDITIPRVKEDGSYDIGSYNASLVVPKSIGPPAYISPSGGADQSTNDNYIYAFNKEQVLPTGIVATFGQAQFFRFELKYHLKNPHLGQASTEIALPPDIPHYQQVIYDQLQPQPAGLRVDGDGNSLATYNLKGKSELEVVFTGWVKTVGYQPNLSDPLLAKDLPSDLVSQYTRQQDYWQTSDPDIVQKVNEITDPEKPVAENARAIYDYVTTTLQYNTARINKDLTRFGASVAFDDPKNAVCMEFTDLFITMSRIAGIPAREVNGYAYTSDSENHPVFYPGLGSDILHAWAEVYLPGSGWVMVDPTWGSTTGGVDFFGRIDLNRIAFVVKGLSSTSPYAAGSYKTNDQQDGDVNVTFADQLVDPRIGLSSEIADTQVIAGLGSSVSVAMHNTGSVALYDLDLEPNLSWPLMLSRDFDSPTVLLPGQKETVWLPLRTDSWLTKADSSIGVLASAHDIAETPTEVNDTYNLTVRPFFAAIIVPIALLILIVIAAISGGWFSLHRWYNRGSNESTSRQPTE